MDANPPFAADAERLRLLYRLPLTGEERRILLIGTRELAAQLFPPMQTGVEVVVRDGRLQPGDGLFDAIVLPLQLLGDSLDGVGRPIDRPLPALLSELCRSMRPGGLIVGHLEQVVSIATARTALRRRISWSRWRCWRGAWTGEGCLRSMKAAGLEAAECYYVEPRITAPMSIVPLAWLPARAHFLRAIMRTHEHYTLPGYLMRLLLAYLGLGGLLQPHLFFWARRPC